MKYSKQTISYGYSYNAVLLGEIMFSVKDVNEALDTITGGRVVKGLADLSRGRHPFVITKTSGLPGKSTIEIPGLIYGNPRNEVKKIAVTMTLTEGSIELARATGVDAIVAHHPIMEASNSGGVPLGNYMDLYDLAVFELHEAFHGLHPGICLLHGHKAIDVDISYAGVEGNVMFYGESIKGVHTLGDVLSRLNNYMGLDEDRELLSAEQKIRGISTLQETSVCTYGRIVHGGENSKFNKVIHTFPHSGFTVEHLRKAVHDHPEVDTFILSISRVYDNHPLIEEAKELNLNMIIGNCHCLEIMENGLPLAYALECLLPGVEVVVFRERITSFPVGSMGTENMKKYAKKMSKNYLTVNKK